MAEDMPETGFWLVDKLREWWRQPPPSDPWDAEIDDAVRQPNAVSLCPRCLEPQAHSKWFCPLCGTAVGPYNNWMPYLWIFSLGEWLLSGLSPRAKFTKLTITGYILLAFSQYGPFAPLYLFRVFRNMVRLHDQRMDSPEDVDE